MTVYEESDVDRPPQLVGGIRELAERIRPYRGSEAYQGRIGLVVDQTGCVRDPSVLEFESSSEASREVAQAYLRALRASRFHPGVKDGDSVAVYLTMTFRQNGR